MEVRAALKPCAVSNAHHRSVFIRIVIPSQRCDGMAARLETPQLEAKTGALQNIDLWQELDPL